MLLHEVLPGVKRHTTGPNRLRHGAFCRFALYGLGYGLCKPQYKSLGYILVYVRFHRDYLKVLQGPYTYMAYTFGLAYGGCRAGSRRL